MVIETKVGLGSIPWAVALGLVTQQVTVQVWVPIAISVLTVLGSIGATLALIAWKFGGMHQKQADDDRRLSYLEREDDVGSSIEDMRHELRRTRQSMDALNDSIRTLPQYQLGVEREKREMQAFLEEARRLRDSAGLTNDDDERSA